MKAYLKRLAGTDPEFAELFDRFADGEVVDEPDAALEDRTRYMAVLATLLGCQGVELFRELLPDAIDAGVSPTGIKEIVYQATAYLGLGRTYPFLDVVNDVLSARGEEMPLPKQGTTGVDTRVDAGEAKQVAYFGDGMRGFSQGGAPGRRHINRWLSGNCFGDYYTRGGLDDREREMVTFCVIAAQGGCEPQLVSHAAANLNLGNDTAFLVAVVSQCLPYIGYPRSLNALSAIDKASA